MVRRMNAVMAGITRIVLQNANALAPGNLVAEFAVATIRIIKDMGDRGIQMRDNEITQLWWLLD